MLYRSNMRRGISLEVIVEEDDNAEVSLDPQTSQLELERDSSPCWSESKIDYCQDLDEDSVDETTNVLNLRQNKEQRKQTKEEDERWRRLGKQRSLSCEILTILDVGDEEQWEIEARDWYIDDEIQDFTSNQPVPATISRKKILEQNEANQKVKLNPTDGNNYHHFNDEEIITDKEGEEEIESRIDFDEEEEENQSSSSDEEMHSSKEDNHEIVKLSDDFPEIKINTTSPVFQSQNLIDFDPDAWITVGDLAESDKEDQMASDQEEKENNQELPLNNQSIVGKKTQKEVTFSDDVQVEILESYESHIEDYEDSLPVESSEPHLKPRVETSPDVIQDHLESVKNIKNIFDATHNVTTKGRKITEKLAQVLQPTRIQLEEKTSFQPSINYKSIETSAKSEENNVKTHTNGHNKEVNPEELPPPQTVASVRQLFEGAPATINHFSSGSLIDKFDHVRSNPTSKILRFGRDKHDKTAIDYPNSLSYINNNNRKNSFLDITNFSSSSLPRPQKNTNLESIRESNSNSHPSQKQQPLSIITDGMNTLRVVDDQNYNVTSTVSVRRSKHSSSSGGIFLRKPQVVSRFNVKKALEENPIYYHIRMEDKKVKQKKNPISEKTKEVQTQRSNYGKRDRLQRGVSPSTTTNTYEWPSKDSIDRSDAESMSSETSDDSGVSKDFNSSILTKFSSPKKSKAKTPRNFSSDDMTSDNSFKWIDPTVLAKIRSVGTTVIFFGPRRSKSNYHTRSTVRKINKENELNLNHLSSASNHSDPINQMLNTNNNNIDCKTRHFDQKQTRNNEIQNITEPSAVSGTVIASAPRIVGVVRKKPTKNNTTQFSSNKGNAGDQSPYGNNSIVYNFTGTKLEKC